MAKKKKKREREREYIFDLFFFETHRNPYQDYSLVSVNVSIIN